jgi:hypothetical protein
MTAESLPDHIRRPHLRPIQPIPIKKDGQNYLALRDPIGLSKETMVVPPQVVKVIQMFRGERSLEDIAKELKGNIEQLERLAAGLDKLGLLWGPTFEQLESQLKQRLDEASSFEPQATVAMGDAQACRTSLEEAFDKTEDPELDGQIRGIVAPHLDFDRGWPNYAAAYIGLRSGEKPDRVVILGTNHFGIGDGVVLTEYGFQTPLGPCPADEQVVQSLQSKLGRPAFVDQLDHLPEHSIELQLPWIQHVLGDVPIVAALIPDPLAPPLEGEGQRTTTDAFVEALGETLEEVGGYTLFVASSDLSHVGPQFGEPRPVDDQRRFDVERHDREMMERFLTGDPDALVSAMKWNRNPTRWCSIGNMTAALRLVQPSNLELIDYRQAYDEVGNLMVTSAAMVLM